MTRINVVDADSLCNQHLFAEWREMPRLLKNLSSSIHKRGIQGTLMSIGPKYVLGPGHVMIFLDKFEFIKNCYEELTAELLRRDYKINVNLAEHFFNLFKEVPDEFYNNYTADEAALALNLQRIKSRMPANAKWEIANDNK